MWVLVAAALAPIAFAVGHFDDGCLPYDSPPPNCYDYINHTTKEPVFIQHVYNCSRFWVCQPDLSNCLNECAPMDNQGHALYFDYNIPYPMGPVCNFPEQINCTNKDPECQCEVWQTCTEDWQCTPDCVLDTHCDDTEYCDYPDGGDGNCLIGCRNGVDCGGCGICENHLCSEPECCSDADCPSGVCIDGKCGECSTDDQCPDCAVCENNVCSNPECCIDTDCLDSEYCEADNTCQPGCRDDTDCPMSCDACENHICSNPECCTDDDCVDLDNPICSDSNECVPGCRDDTMCEGYDAICDLEYTNCNYCNNTDNAAGICNPGCVDNDNCPQGAVCNGYHQCVVEGDPLLRQVSFHTEDCTGCQMTNQEDGLVLHLVGEKGKFGQTICNTGNLDNPTSVDYAAGQNATFDGQAQLGACYKGNMLCKILEGTVTWTADQGSWAPESGRIDFDWSGDTCCTYSCCLSQSPLSASNNMADLVNCESVCPGDIKTC